MKAISTKKKNEEACYQTSKFRPILEDLLHTLSNPSVVGVGGRGVEYRTQKSNGILRNDGGVPYHAIGGNPLQCVPLYIPKFKLDDAESSGESDGSESDDDSSDGVGDGARANDEAFQSEVAAYVESGFDRPEVMHHKLMEVKSFRLASNKTDDDVVAAFVAPLLNRLADVPQDFDQWSAKFEAIGANSLFESFFSDSAESHETLYDAIKDYCYRKLSSGGVHPLATPGALNFVLQLLARLDIVDDECTLEWHRKNWSQARRLKTDKVLVSILGYDNLLHYIRWLEE